MKLSKDRRQLLQVIMELQFAVLETALYLDTHPDDRTVFNIHRENSRDLMSAFREYQQRYPSLVNENPQADFPWDWIDEPWPWEIDY